MLEAINLRQLRGRGQHPHVSPWANTWIPGGDSKPSMAYKGVGLEGGEHSKLEPMQQLTSPPWGDADVSCLLNMLTAGLRLHTPRINTFSGDATPCMTEVSFEQWYHKVQCVKDHYPEAMVWESIIQLLKGPEPDMARNMGPITRVAHIL